MHRLLVFIIILISTPSFSQDSTEYLKHFASVDSALYYNEIGANSSKDLNPFGTFIDYTVNTLLDEEGLKFYISNRNLLTKFHLDLCSDSLITFSDSLSTGKVITVGVTIGDFVRDKHSIIAKKGESHNSTIDGKYPFGGQYGTPEVEIKQLKIKIEDLEVEIPDSAYTDLFNPNSCKEFGFTRPVEVYKSLDGACVYVYIYGGNAAGTWFAKLIFDHKKYIGRIVADYYPLSIHGSFGPHFIGY